MCVWRPDFSIEAFGVINFEKSFHYFIADYELISKFGVWLRTLLRDGLPDPEFYGALVYKFKKLIGRGVLYVLFFFFFFFFFFLSFFFRLGKITRFRRIWYSLGVMGIQKSVTDEGSAPGIVEYVIGKLFRSKLLEEDSLQLSQFHVLLLNIEFLGPWKFWWTEFLASSCNQVVHSFSVASF